MVQNMRKSKLRILDRKNDSTSSEAVPVADATKEENNFPQAKNEITKTNTAKTVVDIGLDISTSTVGVCVLEAATGKMLYLSHVAMTKYSNEYDKADNFGDAWLQLDKWSVRKIYIEEAAKKFSPGFSSADTIMTLGRFNGILSYKIYQMTGVRPVMINVRSARSKLSIKIDYSDKTKTTKQKVFETVKALNPGFPWISHVAKTGKFKGQNVYDKVNEDRSDAWIICRGGQLLGM